MIIYLDNDNICHMTDDGTMRRIETDAFDGKCAEFIEGHRLIPYGETWTRADGEVFHGEMQIPVKPYADLLNAQNEYMEQQHLQEMAELIEEIYNEDLEVIG